MCYHCATLAEYPVCTQQILGVYWLGCQMHPNGRDVLVARCIVFPNQVITMAVICGHIVMVYLALQLGANHTQEAMNTASFGVTPRLCKCATTMTTSIKTKPRSGLQKGGHEEVVRLCRELGASKFDSAILWAASSGHEKSDCFVIGVSPVLN